jgi:hypothetical protein
MKLKLVVASMSVLGLISSPVFAAHTKHKTKMKHHQQEQMAVVAADYKGALPVVQCPRTDMYTLLMDRMGQNVGRAKPTVGCDNPIAFAGGINFDTKWGNRNIGYQGENNQRMSLNDAYLNIFGNVNDFTTAFISADYSNFTNARVDTFNTVTGQRPGIYSSAYTNNQLSVEQGFITIRDWAWAPLFVQLGKQFEDFGRYTIHPMVRSMDQVMTESLHTSANIGFITPMGFHGSAYIFDNSMSRRSNGVVSGHTPTNYGAALGYDQISDQLGWDIGAGYMYNMTGVNDVAYAVGIFNGGGSTSSNANYTDRVAAGTIYGDVNSGPFSLSARYVSALSHFNVVDLGKYVSGIANNSGAKPWSAGLTGGYGFTGWNKNQNVWLGYQASGDAVNLFLPKSRWLAGYGVDMWKNTNVGLEVTHDIDYSTSYGGTGNSSNGVNLRVGVTFG